MLTPPVISSFIGCVVNSVIYLLARCFKCFLSFTIYPVTVHNSGNWPVGSYSLPSVHRSDTEEACPPGFTHHHASLINQQFVFFDLEIIPTSLGPYFLELIGHNLSALNVHFCDRDQPKSKEENPIRTRRQLGLHRHTRALAELCCRTDIVTDPTPVNWPFVGDFFLFGGEKCLPIRDAHVERYLVRLTPGDTPKRQPEWDILCHYMPMEWIEGETHWPDGDFMLPIGRRSGLRTSMTTIIQYEGQLSQDHIPIGSNRTAEGFDEIPRPYECPDTFQRAHFTFVSKTAERHHLPDGDQTKEYNLVGMTAMEFCVRENYTETNSTMKPWPAGDYCVFTMNKECPVGMQASKEFPLKIPRFILKSVDLVDKYGIKLENKHWHEEAQNQVVYFMQCCREDKRLLLRLPPSKDGFYLVSSAGLCSIIPGTLLDREKVTSYLTSPLANKPSTLPSDRDLLLYREMVAQREGVMYLCYYHPGKGLDYLSALDTAPLSTTLNMTEKDLDSMAG
ncbi:hypothetical protein AHF37_10544 [Paragonimus kellicotti]|nr:hypothetical protein AHF37_10544 [Paragonimus kellicotti]